ncbi:MAG TPA: response regulator [Polyangia bacterium]
MTPNGVVRLLLVEDSPTDAKLVLHSLRRAGWTVESRRVEDADAMRAALLEGGWDAVISDWSLPHFSGAAALALLRELALDIPFVIVSGTLGEDVAVEAMRAGARDYVLKDRLVRLAPALERELHEAQTREARRKAEAALRSTEEQLRQAQKMEAIGGLAAGIAHDFNNLLSIIICSGDLLRDELTAGDPLREYVEDIRAAGAHAADLTRQLLAFSRQQLLEPRHIDLGKAISDTERMLRRLIGEDIELTVAPAGTASTVFVDPRQVEQVIMNLAVNARDAMPDGGKLTIETADVNLDESYAAAHVGVTPGPYVLLAVTDSGTGMDKATQARIFEPFFTTKERGKGTGLGLATVFGIVRQSGGSIWVYSELGQGTTFKIYFPRSSQTVVSPSATPLGAGGLRGSEAVLLVEDEEGLRKITRNILRRAGYKVLEAQNGGEALMICEQHPGAIDLMLTDVVMPRMSGPQLSERLGRLRPGLRTMYMSGYADRSVVEHGFLDPGRAFLQKPFTPERLLRKIREVLDAAPPRG